MFCLQVVLDLCGADMLLIAQLTCCPQCVLFCNCAGNAYQFWPQAVLEAVALKHISGRSLPVFAGDLNHMVLVHWAPSQRHSNISSSDDDEEQHEQEQQQFSETIHIADAASRDVAHAAMCLMVHQAQASLRAAGTFEMFVHGCPCASMLSHCNSSLPNSLLLGLVMC